MKNLNISGRFSPYAIDANGQEYNELLWTNGQIGRLTNLIAQTALSLNRNMLTKWMFGLEKSPKDNFGWTMDVNYTYNYSKPAFEASTHQTFPSAMLHDYELSLIPLHPEHDSTLIF